MKIQCVSDLHLEMRDGFTLPQTDSDVIVLAGDIHVGVKGLTFARVLAQEHKKPVVYVAGNHEFYHHDYDEVIAALRREASTIDDVYFLENECVRINGVRFLGATLWTDFRGDGQNSDEANMRFIGAHLNDHKVIRKDSQAFTPKQARALHDASQAWISEQLSMEQSGQSGQTVVVTHHGPSLACQHVLYTFSPMTAGFLSDLEPLVKQADLWICGHSHSNLDTRIGRCRLVSNQAGYPNELIPVPFQASWVIALSE